MWFLGWRGIPWSLVGGGGGGPKGHVGGGGGFGPPGPGFFLTHTHAILRGGLPVGPGKVAKVQGVGALFGRQVYFWRGYLSVFTSIYIV